MLIVEHKFRAHQVNAGTGMLILGTFTPQGSAGADDFFYGRAKSFLWHLLPQCWGLEPLKDAPLTEKQAFMDTYQIDFADLIESLEVPAGQEQNVDDDFIDAHVQQWKDITGLISTLPQLKAVYFTRKTFNGIPNMRAQIRLIAHHCNQKGIRFCKLETPSKFYSPEKQQQWTDTLVLKTTCLKP